MSEHFDIGRQVLQWILGRSLHRGKHQATKEKGANASHREIVTPDGTPFEPFKLSEARSVEIAVDNATFLEAVGLRVEGSQHGPKGRSFTVALGGRVTPVWAAAMMSVS
jgi:hypothetical protein